MVNKSKILNETVPLEKLTLGEANTLASTEKAKRDEMLDDLFSWLEDVDAQLPDRSNPEYLVLIEAC